MLIALKFLSYHLCSLSQLQPNRNEIVKAKVSKYVIHCSPTKSVEEVLIYPFLINTNSTLTMPT